MQGMEPASYWETIYRFMEHMPNKGNIDLCILKGHLLIERSLDHFLISKVKQAKHLGEARLRFKQKVLLAQAFGFRSGSEGSEHNSDWLWSAIKQLNLMRNGLAHNLEYAKLEKQILEFIKFVQDNSIPLEDDQIDAFGELNSALFVLYSEFNWQC